MLKLRPAVQEFQAEALFALRGRFELRRSKGLHPLSQTPILATTIPPPLRSGQVFLDEAEHFLQMHASVRSDGVRVHPGTPFGFPPEYAFGFAGIHYAWLTSQTARFFASCSFNCRSGYSNCACARRRLSAASWMSNCLTSADETDNERAQNDAG